MKKKPEVLSVEYCLKRKKAWTWAKWIYLVAAGLWLAIGVFCEAVLNLSVPAISMGTICMAITMGVGSSVCDSRLENLREHEKLHGLLTRNETQKAGTQPPGGA